MSKTTLAPIHLAKIAANTKKSGSVFTSTTAYRLRIIWTVTRTIAHKKKAAYS